MRKMTKMNLFLLLIGILFTCVSCETTETSDDVKLVNMGEAAVVNDGVYNRYNIHYYMNKGKYYASYANYVMPLEHGFLPTNTKLTVGAYRGGFKVTAVDTGMDVYVQYKAGNMAGMSTDEYIALITSSTPVSHEGLSALDQEGIAKGEVKLGMSKEGVMAAWGYPAKHKTPSTDDARWVYWKDRFRTAAVEFDAQGKVSNIVQ